MLSNKLTDAINAQINAELWSAYLYLSMAMHFEEKGHSGFANWFKVQNKEEQAHAEILMNYMNSRGARVVLKPIEAVPTEWKCALCAFKDTLAHEIQVTALINNLYALAEAEHDYATRGMLDWFVNEQVEEEETAKKLIERLELIGDNGLGIFMMDQDLATRTYTTPAPLAPKA